MSNTDITPVVALGCAKTIMEARKLEKEYWRAVDEVLEDPDLDGETAEEESDRLVRLAEIVGNAWRDIADITIKEDDSRNRPKQGPSIVFPGNPLLN